MSRRILIIKLGALGDVIRTTPLLRVLDGEISWFTSMAALPLLTGNPHISMLQAVDGVEFTPEGAYDLVINLEDDEASAHLASSVAVGEIVGPRSEGGAVNYRGPCTEWFDMSLSSQFGRAQADELKLRNRRSYQEMMFSALGMKFRGEDPVLKLPLRKMQRPGLIGIETRAGGVWPSKRWGRYGELADRLKKAGYVTKVFQQRDSLIDYADDINECEYIICGDTLAMHLGLALEKRVVALFTCTSPHEIYGYGRLAKVVSPLLEQCFYKREFIPQAGDAISTDMVEESFQMLAAETGEGVLAETRK